MDEAQANVEAERLNAEHADRDKWQWVAMHKGGEAWAVVKLPRTADSRPLKATTEARPKPRDAEDPRAPIFRNIPPIGGA